MNDRSGIDPETARRVASDPHFVAAPHHGNSLYRMAVQYADTGGAPPHVAARAMGLTEKQYSVTWARIMQKMRRLMRVMRDE